MDVNNVYEFANTNPLCYLATTEGDQPRVRAFLMWYAADEGLYFQTAASKDVYRQLKANPKVEVCFYATQSGAMMRATGRVVFLDDLELKKKLLDELPYMKNIIKSPNDPELVIFRVQDGEAAFWTIGNNRKEQLVQNVKF
jgi:pyridoxamine 5'-phosphate oxidase